MTEQRPFRREKGFPARGGNGLARIAVFGAIFGFLLAPALIPSRPGPIGSSTGPAMRTRM